MAIGSKQNHRQNQLIASKSRVNRALRVNLLDHRGFVCYVMITFNSSVFFLLPDE
ncbi:hypothetical protein BDV29DRAFT_56823 [Aspergillus leporis]|uniref:Uncharacterized protein n=1 Tax=Aspergillus leporis TaxID=41062 RepID=A0A5N5WLD2_9EURO|nr:hypothetical protein BDV29DRAFT_56823 [Aspergillus leporis]